MNSMNLRDIFRSCIPVLSLVGLLGVMALLAIVAEPFLKSGQHPAAVSAAKVVSLTNEKRADQGLGRLERNALLDQAALMKAQDMAAKGYYAHVSPDGTTPMHWVEKAGYKYLIIGENLVVNRTDAEQVVDAFMGSPGHRANILRKDFTEIGVGVADGTYKGKDATFTVQIFAAPYPQPAKAEAPKPVVKPIAAPVKVVAPVKAPAVSPVPRAAAATSTVVAPATRPLPEKVTELIRPLVSVSDVSSAIASSTATTTLFETPVFFLGESIPVGLKEVSRLEASTLPVPVGSTWSMQFRALLDTFVLRAQDMLGA